MNTKHHLDILFDEMLADIRFIKRNTYLEYTNRVLGKNFQDRNL